MLRFWSVAAFMELLCDPFPTPPRSYHATLPLTSFLFGCQLACPPSDLRALSYLLYRPSECGGVGVPGTCARPAGHPYVRPQRKESHLLNVERCCPPSLPPLSSGRWWFLAPPHTRPRSRWGDDEPRSVLRWPLCAIPSPPTKSGAPGCVERRSVSHAATYVLRARDYDARVPLLWWALLQPPPLSIDSPGNGTFFRNSFFPWNNFLGKLRNRA